MPGEENPTAYPRVPAQPDLPGLEEGILVYWDEDGTFPASVDARPALTASGEPNEFVFYDGPPFANGLPHYGHLLTGFVKDAVPRYQTMRGRRVERRFGWDCHGLPAEMAAESELGVTGRAEVLALGIDRFNDHCRGLVLRTTGVWRRFVHRQARWVDMDDDYKTMDLDYMESVIWAFAELYRKGLAYEGYRVLPYCWECETPLSNFETRQDDAYRPRTDPAVTVRFRIDGGSPLDPSVPLDALVWTTTPWTLPSNLALAVGPEIEYTLFEVPSATGATGATGDTGDADAAAAMGDTGADHPGGRRHVAVSADLADAHAGLLGDGAVRVGDVRGDALVGRSYRPLFPYFADRSDAFRVLGADFVATGEGTGIVHVAPGFGEEDQAACDAAGIGVVCPIDDRARFTAAVPPFEGMQVFDANEPVIEALTSAGALVAREDYEHSYPHCWRTDTPLVYRAVSSWFVDVTALKGRMLAHNQEITWIPAHVRDGAFGKWLEGARDWSISRNRFWGTPIPVWKSDDDAYPRIDVYGSLDELERDFGVRPPDLHRPMIDALTRPNPDDPTGASTMRRIPDVLDCWFESGSMPFAQLHYPFEHAEWFDAHFPADFIVEYIGQVRGWFYTLHVLGTALFDKPPFRTCLTHGIVLGDDGRKLSKRLKNFPDPEEVFATFGADAMRWFMLAGPGLRGQDFMIERKGAADAVRQVIHPLWNAWHFLTLYSEIDGVAGAWRTDAPGVLDRYILAKAADLVDTATVAMDADDLSGACAAIAGFLDALTNWYIRRSRARFWSPAGVPGDPQAKRDAYDTLHSVLAVLCRVAAPLLPLTTEAVYRGLTGERSVHLTGWPDAAALPHDASLVAAMDLARQVSSLGHSIRKANALRARLPLRRLTVASPDASSLEPYVQLLSDELNVKDVLLTTDLAGSAAEQVALQPAMIGPRLGAATQAVLAAARAGDWSRAPDGTVVAGGVRLEPGEATARLVVTDAASSRVLPGGAGVVTLDLSVTAELAAEGLARDVTRCVQAARKDAGLEVTDRILLTLTVDDSGLEAALEAHRDQIAEQVLATGLAVERHVAMGDGTGDRQDADGANAYTTRQELPDGTAVEILIRRP